MAIRTSARKGKNTKVAPKITSGRYTPPIRREKRHSPRWYPFVLLGLLIIGALVVILNYIQALPSSPTNWYTIGGLIAILAGALMATNYR